MDEPVVESVITEQLDNPVDNSDKSEKPAAKKNGRPVGSKDKVKRVVKSRKITIEDLCMSKSLQKSLLS